jgi:RNA polymerase sigma-70 factor (ECF subfamily)
MQVTLPESPDSDDVLVGLAQAGDYVAFESLVRRHQRRVYATALGIVKNTAEAEEVAQETFLSAFEHLDGFRGDARFSTWLFRVASNHALMKLRKKRPEPRGDVADLETSLTYAQSRSQGTSPFDALSQWARRPDEAADANEVQDALEGALDVLSDDDRALLLMRSLGEDSHDVLAERFNTTVPAIKSRLHRIRLQLRANLDERLRGKPPP